MNERRQDFEWLQRFTRDGEQSAFADVVRRHLDLVFATALRKVEDAGAAQEVAQNVFTDLARKAWRFAPDDSLPAWLHKAALLESKSWLRGELRRRRREETAAELGTTMKSLDDQPAFHALVPLLDEALLSLREKDRTALLLRFYESQSLRDVGTAVGVSEDTAQKRVQAALEKLAEFFKRRGFKTATVAATAAALQSTAASASAAMVSTVVGAALQVAPPALVGLGVWQARLARLTKGQKATLCVALAVALLFWLWRGHGEVGRGPKPQPIATQRTAGNTTTSNLQTNERIMKTTTSTQFSLRLLLSAGLMASNALAQSPGQVLVWGSSRAGQIDVPVTAQNGVTAIAAGGNNIMALKTDGSVLVWGGNVWTNVPVAVRSGVIAIVAGNTFSLALKTNGSVVAWTDNDWWGVLNVPAAAQSGVMAIAAGERHAVALKADGSVVAWGWNNRGQTNVPVAALSGVIAVAGGGWTTVALKNDGSVVAWGHNGYGQTNVPAAAQSGITAIAAGWGHIVALKTNGSVLAWGFNRDGQTNVPVAAQSGVTAIAAGLYHTVALKDDGSVLAWGSNSDGQTTVPAGLSRVTTVAAGGWNTVALLAGGSVMPVSLALRPSGNEMILSWPTNATGFTLQSTQTITPPVTWLDVTNPSVVLGWQFMVTNPVSAGSQFFRLKKP